MSLRSEKAEKISALRRLRPLIREVAVDDFLPLLEPRVPLHLAAVDHEPARSRQYRYSTDLEYMRQHFSVEYDSIAEALTHPEGIFVFHSPLHNDLEVTYRYLLAELDFRRQSQKVLDEQHISIFKKSIPFSEELSYIYESSLHRSTRDSLGTIFTIFESLVFYAPNRDEFLRAATKAVEPQPSTGNRSLLDLLSLAPEAFWGRAEGYVVHWFDYEKQSIKSEFIDALRALKTLDPDRNHGGCPAGVFSQPNEQATSVTLFGQKFVEFIKFFFSDQISSGSIQYVLKQKEV